MAQHGCPRVNGQFLMVHGHDTIAGSVGYCPAGQSGPAIFPANWAAILLLAVAASTSRQGQ